MNTSNNKQSAFTIVELLVVIVVIGILAAITIISYTGISNKAIVATLKADLSNASRQLRLFKTVDSNEYYPATIRCDIPDGIDNKCLKPSGDSYYSLYTPNNTTNPRTFILEETNGTIIYRITDDSTPVAVVVIPITAIAAITGTTAVGSVLTAGALTPSGATVTYQWQNATFAGGAYTNISGATASTYALAISDVGKYLKVIATATGSYSGAQTSAASAVVIPAPTQGPLSPGTMADVVNATVAWSNPNNAKVSDGVYATANMPNGGGAFSHFLAATNFGFSIPTDATINGILVEVEGKTSGANLTSSQYMTKNGTTTNGYAGGLVFTSTEGYKSGGGSTNLLGTTWTPTEINSSNFGTFVYTGNNFSGATLTLSIDHIRITVYYTTP